MKNYLKIFRTPTLEDVKQRAQKDIELALHEAQLNLERALATVAMYEFRLQRLKADHA